ncbi:MAG: GMC family oxidoreductase [Bacteroidota bacterium]|nr:GMC family oxidoreductase [Bacteroidota bacterium]MEC8599177.1 GMC family oxidoreductase [Bacteroidota bacterium]
MQIIENEKKYDVVVVGSGAGGGMATKILTDNGLTVALMEAGPYFDPANPDQQLHLKWPYESPRRGRGSTRAFGDFHASYGDWNVDGEPYEMKGDTKFNWWRSRMLGGRTNHWGRISLRFGPNDFKRKSIDGLGDDWPIGYDDIKPYYDKVDKLIGVTGTKENIYNEPDGFFLPPAKPRLHEMYYKKGAEKAGVKVIPSRLSMLTKRISNERGVCYYCGNCGSSCGVYADFSASSCLVFPAQRNAQGRLDLYVNSMVREVSVDNSGKPNGIVFINKDDKKEYKINAKVVVLAASACESARILLNSKSPYHENGLGNSSNMVGKYLHDSTGTNNSAFIPDLMNRKTYNEDGLGNMHLYSPWWLDNKKLDFPRGYHIEIYGGLGAPSYGTGFNFNSLNSFFGIEVGGYGDRVREEVKKYYGSTIGFNTRGESVPNIDNYCEIDPEKKDKYGIPVLRFNYNWSDYERKQAKHMNETVKEIVQNIGGHMLSKNGGPDNGLLTPGEVIHEVGTTRMGNNPMTSVVNKYEQLHDAKNVFIVDGGPFVSQADKNPTWTIMALSWRTSEYIINELKKQNI